MKMEPIGLVEIKNASRNGHVIDFAHSYHHLFVYYQKVSNPLQHVYVRAREDHLRQYVRLRYVCNNIRAREVLRHCVAEFVARDIHLRHV